MSLNFGRTEAEPKSSCSYRKSVIFVNNSKRTSVLVVGFTLSIYKFFQLVLMFDLNS